jgi:hypothetical protein
VCNTTNCTIVCCAVVISSLTTGIACSEGGGGLSGPKHVAEAGPPEPRRFNLLAALAKVSVTGLGANAMVTSLASTAWQLQHRHVLRHKLHV